MAIPLAEAGHRVRAVDLDPLLVADCRRRARGRRLPLACAVGDIREDLAPPGSQDAVVCLWSTFQHLLTARDRRRCLSAFHRALRPGGLLVLEMTDAGEPALAARLKRDGRGRDRRIAAWRIRGAAIRCYLHDAPALAALLAASPFARHRVRTRRVGGGVSRLIGLAWKAADGGVPER